MTDNAAYAPTHMRGWEAFGVAPPGLSLSGPEPTVRRIGTNHGRPELTPKEEAALEDWPDPEVFGGIAGWSLSAWGDDTAGAYIRVWGPDRDAVAACWDRVAVLVPLAGAWPEVPS